MQAWTAFGRLPATLMFVALLAGAWLPKLVLPADPARMLALSLFAAFIAYCVARPTDRMATFGTMALPGAAAAMAENLFGVDGTVVGLALVPVALLGMLAIDRGEAAPDDAAPAS